MKYIENKKIENNISFASQFICCSNNNKIDLKVMFLGGTLNVFGCDDRAIFLEHDTSMTCVTRRLLRRSLRLPRRSNVQLYL